MTKTLHAGRDRAIDRKRVRNGAPAGTLGLVEGAIRNALADADGDTFVWAGCERSEAKRIRDFLKTERGHDRHRMSIGAYWER